MRFSNGLMKRGGHVPVVCMDYRGGISRNGRSSGLTGIRPYQPSAYSPPSYMAVIRQIIFLRTDLKQFGRGAMVAQACHASVYAIFRYRNNPQTEEYLLNIADMTKVVLKIREEEMHGLKEALGRDGVDFCVWIEKPEDTVTCIATRPFVLEEHPPLQAYLQRFKLY